MRIGIGYDVHKLVEDRKLIIGGVHIPYDKGLLGHSDADVLIHAIMDAIIGALSLGDIGKHFPDSDLKYKDANSITLLQYVYELMKNNEYKIGNVDGVIIAQKPKMATYIKDMKINIANVLQTPLENINIKATTEEGLGFSGREEGIAAQAVVLLEKTD